MKTTLAVFFIFISAFCLQAQDSLYTTDGNVIGVKVIEIGTSEVKYKKSSNPDGPLYVISRLEVALIEYQNGTKDIFKQPVPEPVNAPVIQDEPEQVVVVRPRPVVNVVVNALPTLAWSALTWGWGWGWGGAWCRPARINSHHHHYGNHGHYGRRGGRH